MKRNRHKEYGKSETSEDSLPRTLRSPSAGFTAAAESAVVNSSRASYRTAENSCSTMQHEHSNVSNAVPKTAHKFRVYQSEQQQRPRSHSQPRRFSAKEHENPEDQSDLEGAQGFTEREHSITFDSHTYINPERSATPIKQAEYLTAQNKPHHVPSKLRKQWSTSENNFHECPTSTEIIKQRFFQPVTQHATCFDDDDDDDDCILSCRTSPNTPPNCDSNDSLTEACETDDASYPSCSSGSIPVLENQVRCVDLLHKQTMGSNPEFLDSCTDLSCEQTKSCSPNYFDQLSDITKQVSSATFNIPRNDTGTRDVSSHDELRERFCSSSSSIHLQTDSPTFDEFHHQTFQSHSNMNIVMSTTTINQSDSSSLSSKRCSQDRLSVDQSDSSSKTTSTRYLQQHTFTDQSDSSSSSSKTRQLDNIFTNNDVNTVNKKKKINTLNIPNFQKQMIPSYNMRSQIENYTVLDPLNPITGSSGFLPLKARAEFATSSELLKLNRSSSDSSQQTCASDVSQNQSDVEQILVPMVMKQTYKAVSGTTHCYSKNHADPKAYLLMKFEKHLLNETLRWILWHFLTTTTTRYGLIYKFIPPTNNEVPKLLLKLHEPDPDQNKRQEPEPFSSTVRNQQLLVDTLASVKTGEDDMIPKRRAIHLCPNEPLVLRLYKENIISDLYPLHEPRKLKQIYSKSWISVVFNNSLLDEIFYYFGEAVALHFAFLRFCAKVTAVHAIIGIIMLIFNIWPLFDNIYLPVMAVVNILSVIAVPLLWKWRMSRLMLHWGCLPHLPYTKEGINLKRITSDKGGCSIFVPSKWPSIFKMCVFTLPIIIIGCISLIMIMIKGVAFAEDFTYEWEESSQDLTFFVYTVIVYVINWLARNLLNVFTFADKPFSLTENHRSYSDHTKSVVGRTVVVAYIVNFATAGYYIFVRNNLGMANTILYYQLVALSILTIIHKRLYRWIKKALQISFHKRNNKTNELETSAKQSSSADSVDSSHERQNRNNQESDPEVDPSYDEQLDPYEESVEDNFDAFLALGLVFLYSSTFPAISSFVVVYYLIIISTDAYSLCSLVQRPFTKSGHETWAIWMRTLNMVSYIVIAVNCALLSKCQLLQDLTGENASPNMSYAQFVIFEHFGLILKAYLDYTLPTLPRDVEQTLMDKHQQ